MIFYLLLTAITVSIDSFICGFSLSFIKGKKKYIVLIITLTVFLMCLTANYVVFLANFKDNKIPYLIGGTILITVGIYNIFKKENEIKSKDKNIISQSFLIGFAVGIDGAIANLSLSLMEINKIYVPIIIASMHGILISFGILLSKTIMGKFIKKYKIIPPIILIMLGLYKIITTLI